LRKNALGLAYNQDVLVSDFDFELPAELIAQQPPARGESRMLGLSRATGAWRDGMFHDLPELLHPGDLLVLNRSRVIPARLFAQKPGASGKIEVLLTEQLNEWEWRALTRPARKLSVGEELVIFPEGPFPGATPSDGRPALTATVTACGSFGERQLRFAPVEDFFSRLDKLGHMPLPPYIRRQDHPLDRERYQTVYAAERGSVAAPTAGLHFTAEILDRIRARGVRVCFLTLHVGLGTFQPVRVQNVEAIQLHSERYTLPPETAAEIALAMQQGRRIVAVGTTTVRTLEHCAAIGKLAPHSGATDIFLSPGAQFRVVGGLVTNFHLPQSTLLMLVCAFAGTDRVLAAYRHAVASGYRFFSYGDCMFLS
jgi:S-adenosylmethionine:tRNA ribosyltransferase-isomerase